MYVFKFKEMSTHEEDLNIIHPGIVATEDESAKCHLDRPFSNVLLV